MPIAVILILVLVTPFCAVLAATGIGALIAIACVYFLVVAVGLGFFFSYGIKITEKRVTVMSQWMWKTVRYEDVAYVRIVLEDGCISGEIKTKQQERYPFSFTGVDLSRATSLFPGLLSAGLRIDDAFIENAVARLSECEKVKVQNNYKPQKGRKRSPSGSK